MPSAGGGPPGPAAPASALPPACRCFCFPGSRGCGLLTAILSRGYEGASGIGQSSRRQTPGMAGYLSPAAYLYVEEQEYLQVYEGVLERYKGMWSPRSGCGAWPRPAG